jgi:hypothetical protein
MAAVFGDPVVDMHGNIEKAADFINEDHDIEHVEIDEAEGSVVHESKRAATKEESS